MKLQRRYLISTPFLLLTLGLVGFTADSHAQVMKLSDQSVFSQQSVELSLDEFPSFGISGVGVPDMSETDLADVYSVYGISFIAEGGGSPRLGDVRLFFDLSPYDRVLINAPISGTSANRSLILQFRLPLRRLGLFLGGAPAGVRARVSAYAANSQLLGTVEQELTTAVRGTFVGLETAAAEGIFSAVVDYGAESAPELIHRLLADFVSPPQFRTYVPQIAAGKVGSVSYVTTINVTNLRGGRFPLPGVEINPDFPVQVSLFSSSGEPLAFRFNGQEANRFPVTLSSYGTAVLASDPSTELRVGYAVIDSPRPLVVEVEYRVLSSDGSQLSHAIVRGGEAKLFQSGLVEASPNSQTDTGIAILNPHPRTVFVFLTPVQESGDRPEGIPSGVIRLEAGAQKAFMLSEFCSLSDTLGSPCNFPTGGFTGQLHIRGYEPVVVTTLRLVNGLPQAGLTVRSLEPDF